MCILSGEGLEAAGFIYRHPEVILNLLLFSLSSAVGQVRLSCMLTHWWLLCHFLSSHPPWSFCIAVYIHHYHRAGASYLLHLYHHTQVLHYPRLRYPVCQPSPTTAVGGGRTGVPWPSAGCLLWQGLQTRFSKGRQTQNEWNCFTSVHINCLAAISFHIAITTA